MANHFPDSRKSPSQKVFAVAALLVAGTIGSYYLLGSRRSDGPDGSRGTNVEAPIGPNGAVLSEHMRFRADLGPQPVPRGEDLALSSQVAELAKVVGSLREDVASLRADALSARVTRDRDPWPEDQLLAPLPPTQTPAEAFQSQFDAEKGQSEWGRRIAGAVERSFANRVDDSPVFSAYNGSLESTCKKTVCRVSWGAADLATLDDGERDDLLERARWDLVAVIGQTGASGEMAYVSGRRPDGSPEMTVLMKWGGGGVDQAPTTKN